MKSNFYQGVVKMYAIKEINKIKVLLLRWESDISENIKKRITNKIHKIKLVNVSKSL